MKHMKSINPMKASCKMLAGFVVVCVALLTGACAEPALGWKLVWQEDFSSGQLDTAVWSRIPRGRADWQNTQSFDDRCYAMRDGYLVLRGIVNDDREADTAAYLTGGVWTRGKLSFHRGRIEVRARLQGARGAWPAIWMLPFDTARWQWPRGGEIDLMERLNFDSIVYQTVHSHYTHTLGIKDNPPHGDTAPIDPAAFNTYGVDLWPDSVVFHVNGQRTFAYPRIETDIEGQFPFDIPQYLLIDMQLGGQWVGRVDPADLPIEMEVDWVRYSRWE